MLDEGCEIVIKNYLVKVLVSCQNDDLLEYNEILNVLLIREGNSVTMVISQRRHSLTT